MIYIDKSDICQLHAELMDVYVQLDDYQRKVIDADVTMMHLTDAVESIKKLGNTPEVRDFYKIDVILESLAHRDPQTLSAAAAMEGVGNAIGEALKKFVAYAKELIAKMADTLPITFISSVDQDGFPCTKAMLSPRVRDGIKVFYFTTNTFSLRVAHYKANPKACIYFCDSENFIGVMLQGTMQVLTDAKSKEMIWRDGDTEYYPGGVTDPNYCVLKFTATSGRFYSDYYPRSFMIE